VHSVKRSDATSERRFVTKLDFVGSDGTPVPKAGALLVGEHSADQTMNFGGLRDEVRNSLDEVSS